MGDEVGPAHGGIAGDRAGGVAGGHERALGAVHALPARAASGQGGGELLLGAGLGALAHIQDPREAEGEGSTHDRVIGRALAI